ncbi:MAG: pyridoxal phosphate-dependent aminotransferase [Zestosphaera sp.]
MDCSVPDELVNELFGEVVEGLPCFCLERWQSLHETSAKVLLSDSGVHPLTVGELSEYGVDLSKISGLEVGYGWTKGSPSIRERISELYGGAVSAEGVVVTNGSAEANLTSLLSAVKPGDTVLVDMPNYMQIPGLLRWVGARSIPLWRKPPSWRFPLEDALDLMRKYRPKALFVNDPNNPTGTAMSEAELSELARESENVGTLLVFDEVYWGSELHTDRPSILEVAGVEHALSVSGLSKVYGLPGLRIGWVAGDKRVVNRVWGVKDYTSIAPSALSDYIASTILDSGNVKRLRERARSVVRTNLEILKGVLALGGVIDPYWPEAGAYLLARIPWSNDTLAVSYRLFREHSILINPGECFELPGYVRIGTGQNPATYGKSVHALINALKRMVETH